MMFVDDGVEVEEDENLGSVESMKMMFDLRSPCAGKVRWLVQLGAVVNKNQAIAEVS